MNSSTATRLEIQKLKTLPPLSPQTQDVLAVINDPEVSLEKLSELLEGCPSLAARLIGLANSAYFGRCGSVHTVKDAVIKVLGLSVVKGLTVSILISKVLDIRNCKAFRADQYWFVSVLTGMLAQQLTTVMVLDEKPDPGIAYTTGLLSNLGLLALAYVSPAAMSDVFADAEQRGESIGSVLKQRFDFDQYDAGAWLTLRWQLPEVFQDVLIGLGASHSARDPQRLVELLQVSRRLANEIYNNEGAVPIEESGVASLGISPENLNRILRRNQSRLDELRDLARVLSGA